MKQPASMGSSAEAVPVVVIVVSAWALSECMSTTPGHAASATETILNRSVPVH